MDHPRGEGNDLRPGEDPLLGATLGDYQVRHRVGEGGIGIVYQALQQSTGRRVAIKVLRPELSSSPKSARRLLEEVQAVGAIRHPSIVETLGWGQLPSDGRCYLVMEYLDGVSLEQLLEKEAPLCADEVMALLDQVLEGLGVAHAAGVVHRDVKAGNIFVTSAAGGARRVKLLDFGLAMHPGRSARMRLTGESCVVGTPDYMAPELTQREPATAQSDLYSVGVLAFHLLTGRLPFIAPSAHEVMRAHAREVPPRPLLFESSVPVELDALVMRLLAKRPADRPPSAEAVRQELFRIARHLAEHPRRKRKPRTALAMIALAVLASAAALAYLALGGR
ncbi:MAG: serine/threonine protein kinase [Myxococcales bacterium]|nr:serine/threonine protein kinase [Myxococcales bacterium]